MVLSERSNNPTAFQCVVTQVWIFVYSTSQDFSLSFPQFSLGQRDSFQLERFLRLWLKMKPQVKSINVLVAVLINHSSSQTFILLFASL